MKQSKLCFLSSLAPLAAAVNIHAFASKGCGGSAYSTCSNIGQEACCTVFRNGGTAGAVSGQWIGIPGPSLIVGWQHKPYGNICGSVAASHSVGAGNYCDTLDPSAGQFAGLSWQRTSAKRSTEVSECTSSVEPDTFTLEDGHKFNLTAMDTEMIDKLFELGYNGAKADELSDAYSKYEI